MKRLSQIVLGLFLPLFLATLSAHAAESFTGYAVEVLSGASSANPSYDSSLVGLSTSPTGPVSLYRFTSDTTYAGMLSNVRLHRQLVTVTYVGGTITGVYLRTP